MSDHKMVGEQWHCEQRLSCCASIVTCEMKVVLELPSKEEVSLSG